MKSRSALLLAFLSLWTSACPTASASILNLLAVAESSQAVLSIASGEISASQRQLNRIEGLNIVQINGRISGVIRTIEETLELDNEDDTKDALLQSLPDLNEAIELSRETAYLLANQSFDPPPLWPSQWVENKEIALISLRYMSSFQQLNLLKHQTLLYVERYDAAESNNNTYKIQMNALRESLGNVLYAIQRGGDTGLGETYLWEDKAPHYIISFCDSELVKDYFLQEIGTFSRAIEGMDESESIEYARFLCTTSIMSLEVNHRTNEYLSGPETLYSSFLILELYEMRDLNEYPSFQDVFYKAYEDHNQRTEDIFPALQEERRLRDGWHDSDWY